MIRNLVSGVRGYNTQPTIRVREYDEGLRNMNEQQIFAANRRRPPEINKVFSGHRDLLDFFQYSLRV